MNGELLFEGSDAMVATTCHISVLREESLANLNVGNGGRFLDCTFGGGGHSRAILEAHPKNSVVAIDRDLRAIERALPLITEFSGRLSVMHGDFCALPDLLKDEKFDGMLADLGVSTDQLREGRGFSFADDAPLDMRMDESQAFSAHDVVNLRSERELFILLAQGGVGSEAKSVARAIVRARPLNTTRELADVVSPVMRRNNKDKKVHPATVVFQAIRAAVNDEFREIESLLDVAPKVVVEGGRLCVISFHSLEDKLVARRMREWEAGDGSPAWWPGERRQATLGRVLTRKAILPTDAEVETNPSARSARMRVFEFAVVM